MNVRGVVTNMDLLINLRTIQNQYSLKNNEKNHRQTYSDDNENVHKYTNVKCLNLL